MPWLTITQKDGSKTKHKITGPLGFLVSVLFGLAGLLMLLISILYIVGVFIVVTSPIWITLGVVYVIVKVLL
jgi:hypothetical protein